MINMKHRFTFENGKVEYHDKDLLLEDMRNYEGREAYIIVKPYRKVRSDNQNRYYWGVVVKMLCEELGYSDEEMHEVLKQRFLMREKVQVAGVEYAIYGNTSSLSTTDFEDFLSKVRAWASIDLGVFIPEPNEAEF